MDNDEHEDEDETAYDPQRTRVRERRKEYAPSHQAPGLPRDTARRGPTRAVREGRESFKCVHCRAFIGPAVSGGRHRNHCPLCLSSRHVDGGRPGDRASNCGAKMAPVARFTRSNEEPMIVHRCLGCGFTRNNRLAADDNILLFDELPFISEAMSNEQ
ncbi:MAG: RNHCP domain-containing protein [Chloroflexota bacterium]|nr:RNHCP domain-containing protein [Chloroflexota bacterium]